jgi:hypothetical protein
MKPMEVKMFGIQPSFTVELTSLQRKPLKPGVFSALLAMETYQLYQSDKK